MITATAIAHSFRKGCLALMGIAAFAAAPVMAQTIQTVDPDMAIDGDLMEAPGEQSGYDYAVAAPAEAAGTQVETPPVEVPQVDDRVTVEEAWANPAAASGEPAAPNGAAGEVAGEIADGSGAQGAAQTGDQPAGETAAAPETGAEQSGTYAKDDLIGAAEGVFGKGAQGLATMIEGLLEKQGEPNAYIVGREAGGAFVIGARYGSGKLYHKIEGERPVYWTGPSVGFDVGANASNTFVLVYNLYDSEDLFKRFPAGEGQAYIVGGLTASYLRWGDVVLIPIRVGAGLRLGVNAGYMKFSKKHRWLPF